MIHFSEVIASLEVNGVIASLEVIDDSFCRRISACIYCRAKRSLGFAALLAKNFERSQTAIARPLVACKARTSLTSLTTEEVKLAKLEWQVAYLRHAFPLRSCPSHLNGWLPLSCPYGAISYGEILACNEVCKAVEL